MTMPRHGKSDLSAHGFILVEALMAIVLLSCGMVLLLQYQWQRVAMGVVLIQQTNVLQELKHFSERCIVERRACAPPSQWVVREDSLVQVSVIQCPFPPTKNSQKFTWQEILVPWPEYKRMGQRRVVGGYASE